MQNRQLGIVQPGAYLDGDWLTVREQEPATHRQVDNCAKLDWPHWANHMDAANCRQHSPCCKDDWVGWVVGYDERMSRWRHSNIISRLVHL